jgi:hypothetical protein
MLRCVFKAAWLLLAAPLCAQAFETVDVLTPAGSGVYPAYPSEPLPPYGLWAQFGLMHDTNLLRRTTGDNGDTVARLGVGGRYEQRVIGRQSVHLEGRVDSYVYNKYSDIDNVGYGGLAEYRYVIGNDFSGTIGASRRRFQANLSEIQAARYDPITETVLNTTGRFALGPHVGLRGAAAYIDYNRPSRAASNTKTVILTGGADYVTALGNVIGVEVAEAKGDAPVNEVVDPLGIFVNNDFRQRDYGVVATWGLTPSIRFAGRVGRTHREYSQLPGRDFSGPTWNATLQWLPTNKTALVLESSQHVSSIIDIGASHVVVKGVSVGPNWAPTAKLNFQARLVRQHQTFEGDPEAELGVAPLRQELVRGYRLGSYWEYTRQVHFTFSADHGERESNILGRNYRYNAFIAQVRYSF